MTHPSARADGRRTGRPTRTFVVTLMLAFGAAACREASPPDALAGPELATSDAAAYEVVELGTLGGNTSMPTALNNESAVVGWSLTGSGFTRRAFLWQDGVMQDLGDLKGAGSEAHAINELGRVAGISTDPGGASGLADVVVWQDGAIQLVSVEDEGDLYSPAVIGITDEGSVLAQVRYQDNHEAFARGFLWRGGLRIDLGRIGAAYYVHPTAWNNDETVVGDAFAYERGPGTVYNHPFVWRDGQIQALTVHEGPCPDDDRPCGRGVAAAVNANGEIAGRMDSAGAWRAVRWEDDGTRHALDIFPGFSVNPVALNARGRIAGWYSTNRSTFGLVGSWVYRDGVVEDIGSLGGGATQAVAMNNRGDVIGHGLNAAGEQRAFVWRNGQMLELALGPSGGEIATAVAVNDGGDVVGWTGSRSFFGPRQAVLWRRVDGDEAVVATGQ